MDRVLVTGAAGGIGTRLRTLLKGIYPDIRWSDLKTPADLAPDERFVQADLAVMNEVEKAVDGVQGIVHLGGFSVEGPWDTILNANIIGCYNLFEAARKANVERIVFASSNHAVGFYPRQRRIGTDDASAPTRAMAPARRSARRSPRSMPTSTACASLVCGSAISRMRRRTSGGCRSGSRRRTWCS